MLTVRRGLTMLKTAWSSCGGRLRDTLALLVDSLADANDANTRAQIAAQIRRHDGYPYRADERLAELAR